MTASRDLDFRVWVVQETATLGVLSDCLLKMQVAAVFAKQPGGAARERKGLVAERRLLLFVGPREVLCPPE